MSRARRDLYRAARVLGDAEAAAKGPGAFLRRRARAAVYRRTNGLVARAMRRMGDG